MVSNGGTIERPWYCGSDRRYGWNYARGWSKLTVRASQYWQVKAMAISVDTLKAMIRDFHGLEMSDEELELALPAIEGYLAEVEKLKDLDLSNVLSSRLLRAKEGGES
jgi:hypothetical protein